MVLSTGACSTGIGHAPVLGYVVDPNAPWYIVATCDPFERTLIVDV